MNGGMIAGLIVLFVGILVGGFAAFLIKMNSDKKAKCTRIATGKVVKYKYGGTKQNQSIAPLAEFSVDGKKYKAYRHYKTVSSVKVHAEDMEAASKKEPYAILENGTFCSRTVMVKQGDVDFSVVKSLKDWAKEIWPIGSDVKVVYNPENPKQAYVEPMMLNTSFPIILMVNGVALTILGFVIFFLCK